MLQFHEDARVNNEARAALNLVYQTFNSRHCVLDSTINSEIQQKIQRHDHICGHGRSNSR